MPIFLAGELSLIPSVATAGRKLKALEPILNADQMEKYRQLQETQLKFIKNIANQMDPAVPGK